MKVIFLDIDGVVCCSVPGVIEDKLMLNLKHIVERTDAKIVLSSDWRRAKPARQEVRRVLGRHGLADRLIGFTPQCGHAWSMQRPKEILMWVDQHNAKVQRGEAEALTAFVAIDDRALLQEVGGAGLVGHFVMTHFRRGLTKQMADAAIDCLNAGSTGSKNGGPLLAARKPEGALGFLDLQGVRTRMPATTLSGSGLATIGGTRTTRFTTRPTPGEAIIRGSRAPLSTTRTSTFQANLRAQSAGLATLPATLRPSARTGLARQLA